MFTHQHLVQVYETDMMGIVHHGNYLRFFEEARVGWAHSHGILDFQKPETASHLTVLETWVKHLRPARFGDNLKIQVQAKLSGIRLVFEYKAFCVNRQDELVAVARTIHVPLNLDLQVIRPPIHVREVFRIEAENNTWIETWLSNL